MAYQRHTLLQFGGSFFAGETWTCGIRLHNGTYSGPGSINVEQINNANESALDDFWDDIAAYVTDPDAGWSNKARLEWVKANVIGADGRYEEPGRTVAKFATPDEYVSGTIPPYPPQIALVITLRGDLDRGRASRGRFYVPIGQIGMDNNGRINQANREGLAAAAATFLTNINDFPLIDLPNAPTVHVMSSLGNPGPRMEVSRVEVGDVLDTQRRRRNQMDEVYSQAPVLNGTD